MSTAGPDLDLAHLDDHLAALITDIRQRTQALQPVAEPDEPTWEALQELDDEALVRAAYRYLTGHPIEPEQLTHYLTQLRGGEDRFDLLAAIYTSPEGRQHAPAVPGLRRALLKRKVRRIPLIGRLLSLLLDVIGLPGRQQRDNARYLRAQHRLALQAILLQQQGHLLEWHQRQDEQLLMRIETLEGQREAQEAVLVTLERAIATQAQLEQDVRARLDGQDTVLAGATTELTLARVQQTRIEQEIRMRLGVLESAPPSTDALQMPSTGLPVALEYSLHERFSLDEYALRGLLGFYLPMIEECPPVQSGLPLVELGCGDGTWLAALPASIERLGVECNPAQVAIAQGKGLEIAQAEALGWLSAQPDASLGSLCAFDLVERLSISQLSTLLDEALRVLVPGGLLLLQALDPAHPASASAFWLDPMRRQPLPAPLLDFLYQYKGFVQVSIQRPDESELLVDTVSGERLVWQHYGIVGFRAAL